MSQLTRLLLILLFIATVFGQTDTDSVDTTDSGEDTDTNDDSTDVTSSGDDDSDDTDDDDDSDSFDATSDSDDTDSDDDDDDDDDSDDTDSDDDDDSDDTDSDDTDSDDTDSDDDDDTDSDDTDSDTDTDSDDDDDDSDDTDTDSDDTDSSDTDGSSSSTVTTQSSVSYCASLSSSQCSNAYHTDGTAICAVNSVSNNCYAVVASQGMYGSGNFDEGWNAASTEMEMETQNLQLVVGVLGGLVVLLVLCVIAGGCVFYKKVSDHEKTMSQSDMVVEMREFNDDEAGDADTDALPMMTSEA